MDIGQYDGGLEIENEKRGERVYGEAAEDLALDSSISRYRLVHRLREKTILTNDQKITHSRMEST